MDIRDPLQRPPHSDLLEVPHPNDIHRPNPLEIQIIMETPQNSQGHKKRPRLVTSCDTCRAKKVKCQQPAPETKCTSCSTAGISCSFRDRQRYFEERSRAIAGPNSSVYATELRSEAKPVLDAFSVASGSSSPSVSSQSDPRSKSRSPQVGGMVAPDGEPLNRYTPYPQHDSRHAVAPHARRNSSSISSFDSVKSNNGFSYNYHGHPPQMLHYPSNSRPNSYQSDYRGLVLFDSENHQRPQSNLMAHFIQIFFETYSHEFSFLSYQEVLGDFWDHRLNNILANCVAAMAVKHSNLPELQMPTRELHNIAENYIDVAKTLLNSVSHIPSLDTLQAIMLLCWFEHHHHRLPGFRTYYGMASKMSADLALQDTNYDPMSEYERSRRRATWAGMVQLHMTANSFRS